MNFINSYRLTDYTKTFSALSNTLISQHLLKTIIARIRLSLLGLWLGAAVFFGAGVAPAVFGVLRGAQLANANELAGMIVQRVLAVINRGGFEIALFLIVTGFFINRKESRLGQFAEMISLAIVAIM